MSRTHISDLKPYDLKLNEVVALNIDKKRHKVKVFNNVINELFDREKITDPNAKKVKKSRYKKHMETDSSTIGILLNMLINEKVKDRPLSKQEMEIKHKIWWNNRYYRFYDDYNAEVKKAQILRNQIQDLKLCIRELKKNLQNNS